MNALLLADDPNVEGDEALAALGVGVRAARDVTRAQVAKARKVIILWSRAARGTPALRAAARQAKARGTLVCVRLDGALPPPELGGAHAARLPPGRARLAALRRLVRTPKPRAVTVRAALATAPPTTRRAKRPAYAAPVAAAARPQARRATGARLTSALTALALVAFAAGLEACLQDPGFAMRIDGLAKSAQAQAATLVEEIAN